MMKGAIQFPLNRNVRVINGTRHRVQIRRLKLKLSRFVNWIFGNNFNNITKGINKWNVKLTFVVDHYSLVTWKTCPSNLFAIRLIISKFMLGIFLNGLPTEIWFMCMLKGIAFAFRWAMTCTFWQGRFSLVECVGLEMQFDIIQRILKLGMEFVLPLRLNTFGSSRRSFFISLNWSSAATNLEMWSRRALLFCARELLVNSWTSLETDITNTRRRKKKSKRRRGQTHLEWPKSPAKNLYIPEHVRTTCEPLSRAVKIVISD